MKCLDLFCCAGSAGYGYSLAGFDVTGIDRDVQPEYPLRFVQADALEYVAAHGREYDFIHASPPCQHFTKYRNCRKNLKASYEDLIVETCDALIATGRPYVIENVVGAPLLNPITLCGSMFGLDVRRHRLFESNIALAQPVCDHSVWQPNRFPGGRSRERGNARVLCRGTVEVGRWNIPLVTQQRAMGIDWISDVRKLSESVPPAYMRFIGAQMRTEIEMGARHIEAVQRVAESDTFAGL